MKTKLVFVLVSIISVFASSKVFAQSTVLLGVDTSINIGERPGAIIGFRDTTRIVDGCCNKAPIEISLENMVFYDSSQKKDGGWKTGASSTVQFGSRLGVLAGLDYRHRDGGPWTKKTLWMYVGASKKLGHFTEMRVGGRIPLWETAPNNTRAIQGEYRYLNIGSRFGMSWKSGVLIYQDNHTLQTPNRFGFFQSISLVVRVGNKWSAQ